ncbi:MAG TPA: glycosyltransferase family 2 protein, partial [Pseudonocardiaceae bacterium]|nr:glycosyltransferase family 2 protein [Pseudonocardiaceae bacterium]
MMVLFAFGVNFLLWGSVGLLRLTEERLVRRRRPWRPAENGSDGMRGTRAERLTIADVAVLIAAHNEALVIQDSLRAILELVPRQQVHVVSDASTDHTYKLARRMGVRVIRTPSNVGKAGAIQAGIRRCKLVQRFAVVMLLDADTHVEPGYFDAALPLFDDPEVVAVAGCVRTSQTRELSTMGAVLVHHRQRIYAIAQRMLKFGQTWSRVNATHIVPGFASLYRTSVLPHIDINPTGLVIEDFNMTFEVYQKRLGKVAFSLDAVAVTQDPDNFRDYLRQTRRWSLGLWQTVWRHPPRANLFTAMVVLLLLELLTSSLMFVLLPAAVLLLALPDMVGPLGGAPVIGPLHAFLAAHLGLGALLLGIALPDYALTCLATVLDRTPRSLLCGLAFLPLRVVDAVTALYTLPLVWLTKSNGRWRSPTRRASPRPATLGR